MVNHEARICVIGDCALDVTAAPSGAVTRGGDRPAAIRVGPGGQGANVAVRLARRGIAVRLVTALGTDLAGEWLRASLAAEGVEVVSAVDGPPPTTSIVVAILDESGERSMLSHRMPLAVDGPALAAAVASSRWIHCSGYVLRSDGESRPVVDALAGRPGGTPLSIGGGSAADTASAATLRGAIQHARPELLVVSIDEARWLVEDPDGDAAAAVSCLAGIAGVVVVTAAADGAYAGIGGEHAVHVATASRGPALDTTGAGDAFTAALLAHLDGEPWPPAADRLRSALADASRAGAQAARVAGAQGPIPGEHGPGTVSGA